MKQLVNQITGEVYEVNEKHEVAIPKEVTDLVTDTVLDLYAEQARIDQQIKIFRNQLINAMKKHGIKSFKNNYVEVTYIEPTTSTTVDTDKLKDAGLYDEFSKEYTKKESVRIKVIDD